MTKAASVSLPEALASATAHGRGRRRHRRCRRHALVRPEDARPQSARPVDDRRDHRARLSRCPGRVPTAGAGLAGAAAFVPAKPDEEPVSRGRAGALAALNGVVGDHLAETGNPLALRMQFRREGRALKLERGRLAEASPKPGGKLVVLLHGLCMSDLQWSRDDHDHGAALARDLGYAPLYLLQLRIAHFDQRAAFAAAMEELVAEWPWEIEDLTAIGDSMGGLVARSACRIGEDGGHLWRTKLRKLVFLGTPHHGAPLERVGNWADAILGKTPYAAAFTRLLGRSAAQALPICGTKRYGRGLARGRSLRPSGGRAARRSLAGGFACYAIPPRPPARPTP